MVVKSEVVVLGMLSSRSYACRDACAGPAARAYIASRHHPLPNHALVCGQISTATAILHDECDARKSLGEDGGDMARGELNGHLPVPDVKVAETDPMMRASVRTTPSRFPNIHLSSSTSTKICYLGRRFTWTELLKMHRSHCILGDTHIPRRLHVRREARQKRAHAH